MSTGNERLRREDLLFGAAFVLLGALAFWRELQSGSFRPQLGYWLFDSGLVVAFLGIDFLRRRLRDRPPDALANG